MKLKDDRFKSTELMTTAEGRQEVLSLIDEIQGEADKVKENATKYKYFQEKMGMEVL